MSEEDPRAGWSRELPSIWDWAKFSDVALDNTDSTRKLAKKLYQSQGRFPVIDQGEEFASGFSDDEALVSTVSLPCIVWGDHTRRSKFVNEPFVQGADGVKVLEPSEAVLPEFLFHQIAFAELPDKGYSRHFKFLKAKDFPLPPLPEQRRIVNKIDTLSARNATARNHLTAITILVERMRGAVLSKALNGMLLPAQIGQEEPKKLGQFITAIEQGWSPKCENEPETNADEWAVLTTTAIQAIDFDSKENKKLPSYLEPRPHLEVQKGDVLMTRAGPRVRCAVCCFVSETSPRRIFSDKVYRVRLDSSVDPEFFVMMMNTPELIKALNVIKTGGSESGLNLTQGRLKSLSINLWDVTTQRNVVTEIKKQFAKIDRLAAEADKALKLTDRLDQRILAKAFAGELVHQDPTDEPASVLLDRIREARATASIPKRGRRKKVAT